jgi:putative tricarboxylic transport membrane protein
MGFVLGRLLETSFAQSLMMSGGSYDVFFHRPITVAILLVALSLLAVSGVRALRARPSSAKESQA